MDAQQIAAPKPTPVSLDTLKDEMRRRGLTRQLKEMEKTNPKALESLAAQLDPRRAAAQAAPVVPAPRPVTTAAPTRPPAMPAETPEAFAQRSRETLGGANTGSPTSPLYGMSDAGLEAMKQSQRESDARYAAPAKATASAAVTPEALKAQQKKAADIAKFEMALQAKMAVANPDPAAQDRIAQDTEMLRLMKAEAATLATPAAPAAPTYSKAITDSGDGSIVGNTAWAADEIERKYGGADAPDPASTNTASVGTMAASHAQPYGSAAEYLPTGDAAPAGKTVIKTGKDASGRSVVQYSDGTIAFQ